MSRHTFTDLVSGRKCTLVINPGRPWFEGGVGAEHPDCARLASVHPDLDAFWCDLCQWNGRISGAWVVDVVAAEMSR